MTDQTSLHSATRWRSLKIAYRFLIPLFSPIILFALPDRTRAQTTVPAQSGVSANTATREKDEARTLELGKSIERELVGSQSHSYQVTLAEGLYLNVVVEQRGIDVVVTLFDPAGERVSSSDSTVRGQEKVTQVVEIPGPYQIEVRPSQKDAPSGSYSISSAELRPATENDRVLQESRKLNMEFNRLYREAKYNDALPIIERVIEIRERVLGPEHLDVVAALYNLALLYSRMGNYAKAKILYQRVLRVVEKVLGPEEIAVILNNLANLYTTTGDYSNAEFMHQRVLAIWEKEFGQDHLEIANPLHNLAVIYCLKGEYTRAEPLFERALMILERSQGPGHIETAPTLHDLAFLYQNKGESIKAESFYQRALTIREKAHGLEHPSVAQTLSGLASLHLERGDYGRAELLHKRALAIKEKALGTEHPDVAKSLNDLATLYASTGEIAKAIGFQSRASLVSEHNLALNLVTGSERQKLAYLAKFVGESNQTVSLHIHAAPTDAAARSLALTAILRRKGRALDSMTDSISALRRRASPQDQKTLDQLQEVQAQLARLVLNGPQKMTPEEHQNRIKALEEQKENLEGEISTRSAEFRAQSQPVTLATVQAALPANTALIEFFAYRPFNAKYAKAEEQFGEPHYVAYVLQRQGEAQWVELGEAKAIDDAVDKLRQALRDKNRQDGKQLARAVDRMVMQPVRPLLGNTRRVFLSPDGALNLLPFAALVDERGQYLVKQFEFSYLSSGRDLLRLQVRQVGKQNALVVANPDFGELSSDCKAAGRALKPKYQQASQPSTAESFSLADVCFPPLPGTAGEAEALKAMMPEATVLTAAQATEAALKQVDSPNVLHIATHGFFLSDLSAGGGEGRELKQVKLAPKTPGNQRIENPLLRSGLALTGANLHKSGEDDGVLTAAEASTLDLWGTKLVVLSACDTGVGEVKSGDGVYGLRRALVLAGSESQLMSLWPVSDSGTRDLMVEYYRVLQRGEGRTTALRQVQLRMLDGKWRGADGASRLLTTKGRTSKSSKDQPRARDYSHPYYWASFIQSGDWRSLNGVDSMAWPLILPK